MTTLQTDLSKWFVARLPKEWFEGAPEITLDNDEILVVGHRAPPKEGVDPVEDARDFREATREQRMAIARDAERQFDRKVSWGVEVGDRQVLFTTASAPVMTRLRLPERKVLDTLVEAGVARSRSDALAWCVRLVGRHEADWLEELRTALVHVQRVRAEGPVSL